MNTIVRLSIIGSLTLLAACGSSGSVDPGYTAPPAPRPSVSAVPWPLPSDPMSLVRRAGLTPGTHEFFTHHVHAHLDVFVNGRRALVPAGIGIDIADPAVHHGMIEGAPSYGGIELCARPCVSPLHTHDVTGVIHIESPTETRFNLGEFFREWGVRLDGSCVGGYCEPDSRIVVFVDGRRRPGDPSEIELTSHEEIAVAIGTPPSSIPATFAFPPGT
jgi:hypothetical protein